MSSRRPRDCAAGSVFVAKDGIHCLDPKTLQERYSCGNADGVGAVYRIAKLGPDRVVMSNCHRQTTMTVYDIAHMESHGAGLADTFSVEAGARRAVSRLGHPDFTGPPGGKCQYGLVVVPLPGMEFRVITGDDNQCVTLWKVVEKEGVGGPDSPPLAPILNLQNAPGITWSCSGVSDWGSVFAGGAGGFRRWDLVKGTLTWTERNTTLYGMDTAPERGLICSSYLAFRLFDNNTLQCIAGVPLPGMGKSVYIAEDVNMLLFGSRAGEVFIYDLRKPTSLMHRFTVAGDLEGGSLPVIARVERDVFVSGGLSPPGVASWSTTGKIMAKNSELTYIWGLCSFGTPFDRLETVGLSVGVEDQVALEERVQFLLSASHDGFGYGRMKLEVGECVTVAMSKVWRC